MRGPIFVIALACLGGCATTPMGVMSRGQRFDYSSAKPARTTAHCIERNAAEVKWGLLGMSKDARTRDGPAPGTYQVVYSEMGVTIAIAEVQPRGEASSFSVWLSPDILGMLRGDGTLEEQMVKGC